MKCILYSFFFSGLGNSFNKHAPANQADFWTNTSQHLSVYCIMHYLTQVGNIWQLSKPHIWVNDAKLIQYSMNNERWTTISFKVKRMKVCSSAFLFLHTVHFDSDISLKESNMVTFPSQTPVWDLSAWQIRYSLSVAPRGRESRKGGIK